MKHTFQSRLRFTLSLLAAAVPFAFALVRAIRTGTDFRYFRVALASLVGAAAATAVLRVRTGRAMADVALAAGVFAAATMSAVLAALWSGTRLGPGVIAVGSAFGFCFAAAVLLNVTARRRVG
jgi:hypothetical protein